jgi:hypothetical protein
MARLPYRNIAKGNKEMVTPNFDTFDTVMGRVNGYDSLALDRNNDVSLGLLADGVTAVVLCRYNGELNRFTRETYWNGGSWSDVDVDEAIYGTLESLG